MDIRRLGNSGLTVSVVGLGGNNLGRAGTATETADGAAAVISAATSTSLTITLDSPQTVGALQLGNSGSTTTGYPLRVTDTGS